MYLKTQTNHLMVRLAAGPDDLRAVQRLRYRVFVAEAGANGPGVDHVAGLETDPFDVHADHLLLVDPTRDPADQIVGTYRLMTAAQAQAAGGFYSAAEYDLGPLLAGSGQVLELGRSCLDPMYRGGTALLHLWQGIGRHVAVHQIDTLFGVASFPGTDPAAVAQPLSLLQYQHLAPAPIRPRALGKGAIAMDLLPPEAVDTRAAMLAMPTLIKSYLRLGGTVGEGAYIDRPFNTIDVCMILQTARMSARQRALYGG